jgi:hypothetical protein
MRRTIGAFVLLGSLLGACGVGDPQADTDNRDEQLGIVCNATFTTTGSFVAAAPTRPVDNTGCWPVGTWTFTAKIDQNECDQAPSVLASYQFKVDRAVNPDPTKDEGYVESYAMMSSTSPLMLRKLSVSEIASGCQAGVELFSADGTQFWNMRPLLSKDGTISGFGEYALYDSNQNL